MSISALARRVHRDDAGFGLAEVLVAIFVAVFVFAAVGSLLVTSLKATLLARSNQQSADVLNQQIEYVRSLDYAAVTMSTTDATLAGDPNIIQVSGKSSISVGATTETLVLAPVGAIQPHTQTITRNGTTYTVSTYVSCPPEGNGNCLNGSGVQDRRVTVILTWRDHKLTRTRRDSTIIVQTRRGLPLPYFRFGNKQTVPANIGGPIVLPVVVTNLGARDSWDLSTGSGVWTWWWDSDNSGTLDVTKDTQLSGNPAYDTNGNGLPETGLIDSGKYKTFFAVRTATTSDIGTTTVSVGARSVAQPSATTAYQTFTDTVQTKPDYCPGCVSTTLYFHNLDTANKAITDSSKEVKPLIMNFTAPTTTAITNYTTNLDSTGPGRHVVRLASSDSMTSMTNYDKVIAFERQTAQACELPAGGYAAVTIYGLPVTGFAGSVIVAVGKDNNGQLGNFQIAGQQTYSSLTWATSLSGVTLSINIPTTMQFAKSDWLEVRVYVPTTSSSDMHIGYDTTTYPAYVSLPLTGPTGSPPAGSCM